MITTKSLEKHSYQNPIILFDGDCILCSRFVQWIIKHDDKKAIRFCAFQHIENNPFYKNGDYNTVILIEEGKSYTKSDVTFKILKALGGFWVLLLPFGIIPSFIRNGIYDLIADNRYKWFGKEESCLMMTEDIRSRMIMY